MIKYVVIAILSMASIACNNKQILPKATMVAVLADMHLADTYSAMIYQKDTNGVKNMLGKSEDTLKYYYSQIFALHGTNEKQVMSSIQNYASDAVMWDALYQQVAQRLEQIRPKGMH
jgi:hypothetical protein